MDDNGEIMEMEHDGDDGDEAMYDGNDVDEAKLQMKPAIRHGGGI